MKEEFKMKKIMTAIIISTLVIVLGGTTIFAAGRGRQASQTTAENPQSPAAGAGCACSEAGQYFTDTDGNGICDYRNTDDRAACNYSNADDRTGACPYNNNCMPAYRRHANGNGNSAQFGHRGQEHHVGFR